MPKIKEELKLMLEAFTDEGLEEEELEAIETGLDAEQQEEFQSALKDLFDERDEFSKRVDKAHFTLTKLIIDLAAGTEGEEQEEDKNEVDEEGKKIKKYKPWGFTLLPEED